jgi:hypothetical protein
MPGTTGNSNVAGYPRGDIGLRPVRKLPSSVHSVKLLAAKSVRLNGSIFYASAGGEVRWLYVGDRYSNCGILGCYAGWKVAYTPSKQLLEQV